MTFSTALIERELASVRSFDGSDCAQLTPRQLHDVSDALGRARRSLDALVVMVAGEVGRRSAPELGVGGLSRSEGFSTPQEMLAKTLGTSTFDAKRLIDVGKSIAAQDAAVDANNGGGMTEGTPFAASGTGSQRAPESAPRFARLAQAVAAGSIGVEAAALVTRTLNALEPVLVSNASVELGDSGAATPGSESHAASPDDARVRATSELTKIEEKLVDKAQRLSLAEFRRACDRERSWIAPRDLVERERRHRENRTLYFSEDADGMTVMTAKLDVGSAAPIKAWIEAQVRHGFQQRRDTGAHDGSTDVRSAGQMRVDALASLASHGLDCDSPTSGVKTTVVVRVEASQLESDLGLGECDQVSGPISASTLRMMAVDAEILPVVMGGESLPLDLGRAFRLFTKAQRIALLERDGGCSWCHAPPAYCEAHHIRWWGRDRGNSDLANGVMLCTGCHHRLHRDDWTVEVREGEVWFQQPPTLGREKQERIGGKAHLALNG
ncbi:DUF222 domain-containing protein [Demequina aurantiaca]|uniref:DUF222 domain-containing protein n=1 Tax=Demequina aurantiaca TaxID=676200 RepID=UPI003D352947